MLLAIAPGYLSPTMMVAPLAFLGAAIAVDLLALALSRLFNNDRSAVYTLVIGGGLVAAAFTVFTALTPAPDRVQQTGFISLLLLIPILEAGLLLSPELTVGIAGVAAAVTGVSVVLALALSGAGNCSRVKRGDLSDHRDAAGRAGDVWVIIAWLIAGSIDESARDSQRSQEQKFALAQLDMTNMRIAQQQERINQSVLELRPRLVMC